MSTDRPTPAKKHRRARGSGSVFKLGRVFWISYKAADGRRVKESSGSQRKGDAERLLDSRNGSRIHNLPVVKNAERLMFTEGAQLFIDDYVTNKRDTKKAKGKIDNHLLPFFGGMRMVGITTGTIKKFIAHRMKEGIINRKGERIKDVSNAEVNRELAILKRCFALAIQSDQIAMKPHIPKLQESAARSGFLERAQISAVLAHLPSALRPVVEFTYITGWRCASEVLPLEWRNVDFKNGEVTIDAGASKNREPRVFPMTSDLCRLLEAQWAEHEQLRKAGHVVPWVFFRLVANGRGGEQRPKRIVAFGKAWDKACRSAGIPGRIIHDMRRSAVRNLVRAGIPERVAMQMTGHKTRSVFERYNITSDTDLREAAVKMNAAAARR
jgi:integrase